MSNVVDIKSVSTRKPAPVRMPTNERELLALMPAKLREVCRMLIEDIRLLTSEVDVEAVKARAVAFTEMQQSEKAHKLAIAGLVSRYGERVYSADNQVHQVSLLIRASDVRALPPVHDVRYGLEPDGMRCVLTSAGPIAPAAAGASLVTGG